MQQQQLYLKDTYQTSCETHVARTGRNEDATAWVALAENIFHPQGGGQPSDIGTINDISVRPQFLVDDRAWVVLNSLGDEHELTELAIGDAVTAIIDEQARLLHAALHTAGHLVDAVASQRGWQRAGNNHFPGQSRVTFDVPDELRSSPQTSDVVEQIQQAVDGFIAQDLAVSAHQAEDGFRTISIGDLQTVPCAGTHVKSLGLLRDVKVTNVKVKGGTARLAYDASHRPEVWS